MKLVNCAYLLFFISLLVNMPVLGMLYLTGDETDQEKKINEELDRKNRKKIAAVLRLREVQEKLANNSTQLSKQTRLADTKKRLIIDCIKLTPDLVDLIAEYSAYTINIPCPKATDLLNDIKWAGILIPRMPDSGVYSQYKKLPIQNKLPNVMPGEIFLGEVPNNLVAWVTEDRKFIYLRLQKSPNNIICTLQPNTNNESFGSGFCVSPDGKVAAVEINLPRDKNVQGCTPCFIRLFDTETWTKLQDCVGTIYKIEKSGNRFLNNRFLLRQNGGSSYSVYIMLIVDCTTNKTWRFYINSGVSYYHSDTMKTKIRIVLTATTDERVLLDIEPIFFLLTHQITRDQTEGHMKLLALARQCTSTNDLSQAIQKEKLENELSTLFEKVPDGEPTRNNLGWQNNNNINSISASSLSSSSSSSMHPGLSLSSVGSVSSNVPQNMLPLDANPEQSSVVVAYQVGQQEEKKAQKNKKMTWAASATPPWSKILTALKQLPPVAVPSSSWFARYKKPLLLGAAAIATGVLGVWKMLSGKRSITTTV